MGSSSLDDFDLHLNICIMVSTPHWLIIWVGKRPIHYVLHEGAMAIASVFELALINFHQLLDSTQILGEPIANYPQYDHHHFIESNPHAETISVVCPAAAVNAHSNLERSLASGQRSDEVVV